MAILVDTHAFLWFVFDDPRLSAGAAQIFDDHATKKLISTASLWEIAVKVNLGKLRLGVAYDQFIRDFILTRDIDVLQIACSHLETYVGLPLHHRDPFDRLLVAQCVAEGLPLVSRDDAFADYGLDVRW